jgi:hypothetical protein
MTWTPTMVFILIKSSQLGSKPSILFDNRQQGGMGQNFNKSEPSLKDIVQDQLGWTESEIQEDELNWSSRRGRESWGRGRGRTEVQKGEENLGKVLPKDISDAHLLPCSATILDDLPNKMGDTGVPTISYLIGTQKFDQALWSWSNREHRAKGNLWLAESWFLGPYFPASTAGGSIDLASSGNRGRCPDENRKFFRACGFCGFQEWLHKNERYLTIDIHLEYHQSHNWCCS